MLKVREHFPYADKPDAHEIDCLKAFSCPGETITLSFSLESDDDIPELEISASSLSGNGGTFGAGSIEVYVVHVWDQAGIGVYQSARAAVRELLLKDDRVPLTDRYTRHYKNWRHFFKPSYVYNGPDIRLTGNVRTSLQQNLPKQIWLSIKAPRDCEPGIYRAVIEIAEANSNENNASPDTPKKLELPVEIEIAPVQLREPMQERMLWYRGKLDWRDTQHYVSEDIFRAQLRDIFEHGFTSVSISETDRDLAQKAIEIVEDIGFNRYVVFRPPFPNDPHTLKYKSITPILYLSDEIDIHLAHPQGTANDVIAHHKLNWQRASSWKMKSMISIGSHSFAKRLFNEKDIGHAPDVVSYYIPNNREFVHLNANLRDARAAEAYYYWQAYMEKPNLHRALAGVYLWKSGFAGISPYCYQHMPVYPNSPFNDFDEWEPFFHVGSSRKPFKDHMLTYPATQGSIPTIQWEAFRDGIADLRSLVTLQSTIEHVRNSGADHSELLRSIEQRRDEFLKQINLKLININNEIDREPYNGISPNQYQTFREDNLRDIARLQQTEQ